MTRWTFRLQNLDTGAYLGDLVDYTGVTAGFEYSAISSFKCDYPLTGRFSSLLDTDVEIVGLFDGVEQRNARWVARGLEGDTYDENGGKTTISGLSLLDLLRKVVVYATTVFTTATPGGILKSLLSTAATRTAFGATAITTATFSSTLDSNGVAWSQTFTKTYSPGDNYRAIVEQMVQLGLIDFEFDGRELRVYNFGTMGVASPGTATLSAGAHVMETPFKESTEDKANVVLVEGEGGVLVERTVSGVRREESYAQQSGVTNGATLNVIGDNLLAGSSVTKTQKTIKIAVGSPTIPFEDFKVGDFVIYDDGFNAAASNRVRQVALEIDNDGNDSYSCALNDLILEGDIKRALQLQSIAGGVSGATIGTPTTPAPPDTTVPAAPASVNVATATYVDGGGTIRASATVTWSAVTTNTDTSAITDLRGYDVQINPSVGWGMPAGQWSQINVTPAGTTTAFFGPLAPGSTVQARVRAVDNNSNAGAFTLSSVVTVVSDTTPPPQPKTPTVDPFFHGIRVIWDGLDASSLAMPADWQRTEIHVSATSGFTPSSATYVDSLFTRGGAVPVTDLPVGVAYFAKLVAYDTTGNASTPSAQASATTELLSDPDLPAKLVTGAKIADKTIAVLNLTVGAFTDNLAPNAAMDALDVNGRPNFWNNNGAVQGAGSITLISAETTAPISGTQSLKSSPTTTASFEALSDTLSCTGTEIYYVKAEIRTSRVLVGGGVVEIAVYTNTTTAVLSGTRTSIVTSTGGTTNFSIEGSFTAPAGHKFMAIGLWAKTDTGGTYDAFFDDIELRKIVGTANIANASINNAKIANLAVDDAKIASLAAGKITTGTLVADVVLGAKIRTATSGNRVDISGIGIEMYRSTFRTGWWRPDIGQIRFYNDTDATLTSTGHGIQCGDSTDFNLIIDDNEIMARNNGARSLLLLNKGSGDVYIGDNTAFPSNPYTTGAARFNNDSAYISVPLRIWAGTDAAPTNENPPLLVGDNAALHIQIDNNEILAASGDVLTQLYIQNSGNTTSIGGNIEVGTFASRGWIRTRTGVPFDSSLELGDTTVYVRDYTGSNTRDLSCRTLFQTSSRDAKTNLVDISNLDLLPALATVPVYEFTMMDDPVAPVASAPRSGRKDPPENPEGDVQPHPNARKLDRPRQADGGPRRSIGPLAEDLVKVFPQGVVSLPESGLAIDTQSMLGALFLAGKKLRSLIVGLNGRTTALETDMAAVKAKVGL